MYIILFSNGGGGVGSKAFFKGISLFEFPREGGGGNLEPPLDLRMPVRLSGFGWPKNWTQLLHAILDGVTSTILVTIRHHKMSSLI